MLAACERQNRVIFTPFLSESEGRIVEQVCGKSRLQRSWGGYAMPSGAVMRSFLLRWISSFPSVCSRRRISLVSAG